MLSIGLQIEVLTESVRNMLRKLSTTKHRTLVGKLSYSTTWITFMSFKIKTSPNPTFQYSPKIHYLIKTTFNQRYNMDEKWTFNSSSREPMRLLSPHHYECAVVALWSFLSGSPRPSSLRGLPYMMSANCLYFWTPPPLSLSQISWLCSFCLLFGNPPPPTHFGRHVWKPPNGYGDSHGGGAVEVFRDTRRGERRGASSIGTPIWERRQIVKLR